MNRSAASRIIASFLLSGGLVSGFIVIGSRAVTAGERPSASGPGMTIYQDPTTGQFVPPPADVSDPAYLLLTPSPGSSTSHVGLVAIPSPVAGGGIVIDLQGRFRSPLTATLGPDGKVIIQHQPTLPATSK